MAFTAGYFALGHYEPKVLAFMGCDMVYTNMLKTHFYGVGTADPLREDITLRDLEAKSVRLQVMGARQGCAVVNLSHDPSRLTFPCAELDSLGQTKPDSFNENLVTKALELERNLGYYTPSGRYWEDESRFNTDKIDELDKLWSHIKTRGRMRPCEFINIYLSDLPSIFSISALLSDIASTIHVTLLHCPKTSLYQSV